MRPSFIRDPPVTAVRNGTMGSHRVEIVYETHSISVDNERGIASGWSPGELSERGRALARELGERRREDGLAAVYSSDLRRAVETAEIAFAGSGIPVSLDARLRECDYGTMTGMPSEGLASEVPNRVDTPYPGGESYRDVVERMRSFLDDVVRRHDGERILLVSHAAPRWALQFLLEGTPLEEAVVAPFAWQPGWDYVFERSIASSGVESPASDRFAPGEHVAFIDGTSGVVRASEGGWSHVVWDDEPDLGGSRVANSKLRRIGDSAAR